jgi:hypothetical protein
VGIVISPDGDAMNPVVSSPMGQPCVVIAYLAKGAS